MTIQEHIQQKIQEYERLRVEMENKYRELTEKYRAERLAIDAVIAELENILKGQEIVQ